MLLCTCKTCKEFLAPLVAKKRDPYKALQEMLPVLEKFTRTGGRESSYYGTVHGVYSRYTGTRCIQVNVRVPRDIVIEIRETRLPVNIIDRISAMRTEYSKFGLRFSINSEPRLLPSHRFPDVYSDSLYIMSRNEWYGVNSWDDLWALLCSDHIIAFP